MANEKKIVVKKASEVSFIGDKRNVGAFAKSIRSMKVGDALLYTGSSRNAQTRAAYAWCIGVFSVRTDSDGNTWIIRNK